MIDNRDGGEGGDAAEPMDDESLSADDIAWMEREKAGGSAYTGPKPKDGGGQKNETPDQSAPKQEASDDDDDEDEPDSVEITEQGVNRDKKTGQFVPKSAFLRQKEVAKTAKQQLADKEAQLHKMSGRFEQLAEIIGTLPVDGKKPDAQKPDNPFDEDDISLEDDMFGAIAQERRRNAFLAGQMKGETATREQRDADAQMATGYVTAVKAYAKTQPLILDAYMHLKNSMHTELELVEGITDKAQRDKIIAEQEAAMVRETLAKKGDPADRIWKLAQVRGFRPEDVKGKENVNGKTQQQIDAEQRLSAVNRGMQETRSLSGSGGKANEGLTFAKIDAMDDDEFASFHANMTQAQKQAWLEGR